MSSASLQRGAKARIGRAALLATLAAALAGCSTLEDFNPFAGERYKTVVEPVLPASQVYDQGLAKLANGNPGEAAKKFTDLGKKYPGSDWARKGLLMTTYAQYSSADYDDAAGSAMRYVKEYPHSPEAQIGRASCRERVEVSVSDVALKKK